MQRTESCQPMVRANRNAAMGMKRMTVVMNIQRLKELISNFAKLKAGNTQNLFISQSSNIHQVARRGAEWIKLTVPHCYTGQARVV
jgi:hypothetical protein